MTGFFYKTSFYKYFYTFISHHFIYLENYHDQAGVLDEVEIKVENDAALGTDPLGDVEQFLTKHSDKFSTACDPERISFLQKSDHETVIKSRRYDIGNFVKSVRIVRIVL